MNVPKCLLILIYFANFFGPPHRPDAARIRREPR
jgi:hypothetical protein